MIRLAPVAVIVVATGLASARPTLDGGRLDQLGRYDVLAFSDPSNVDGLDRGKAIGVFDATPEEVFRVAGDFAKWPDYIPKVRGAKVVSESERMTLVEMTAELPWPVGQREVLARYTAERLPGEVYRIRFEMVKGTMRHYAGSIYIEPWDATGTKTAVTYELVAEPDILAPKSAINKATRRSASGFVHALRQRINDLHKLGLLHPLQPATPRAGTVPVRPTSATR
jgi:ribosome-associated toxin RatA of RatAB toxin-antitoxin module